MSQIKLIRFTSYAMISLWGLFLNTPSHAQKADSLAIKADTVKKPIPDSLKIKKHSPKVASLMSAALPGLGQVYNKKYWKVPIVYAAFAADYYAYTYNQKGYVKYKQAYLYRTDGDSTTTDKFVGFLDETTLKNQRDEYRKYRDLNFIIAAGIYVLNIVDANVDAHLFYFDVSDDLSLHFQPMYINYEQPYMGLTMQLNLHSNKKTNITNFNLSNLNGE